MDAIERLPDETAASIQASLLAVTVEDVCRILFRHATEMVRKLFKTCTGKIVFSVDYSTWTITMTHEVDPPSQLSSHSNLEAVDSEDDELDLLSYLGLVHLTTITSTGTEVCIWQDGRKTRSEVPATALATPLSSGGDASNPGVTISVRDVFHGMPVRRRFIASEAEKKSHVDSLARCSRELSLLAPEASVRVTLRHAPRSDGSLPAFKAVLHLPRSKDLTHRYIYAFGAEELELNRIRPVSKEQTFASVKMRIVGFVCTASTAHAPQIVFLQGRVWPGAATRRGSTHSDRESAVFASLLSRYQLGWTEEAVSRHTRHRVLSPDLYKQVTDRISASSYTGRTTVNSIAFVLKITLSHHDHATAQPESAVALDSESFPATLLDAISSVSSTDEAMSDTSRKRKRSSRPSTTSEAQTATSLGSSMKSRPATASLAMQSYAPATIAPEGMVEWRDPTSGRLFHVDLRTGHSIPVHSSSSAKGSLGPPRISAARQRLIVDRSNFRRGPSLSPTKRGPLAVDSIDSDDEFDDASLDAALASIPSPSQAAVVDVSRQSRFFDSRRPESSSGPTPLRNDDVRDLVDASKGLGATELEVAISKSDLQSAQVLDQVDGKFILCTTSPAADSVGTKPVLFCIDQHAADERYRLERLLHDYVKDCSEGIASHALPTTLTLGITAKQHELITANAPVRDGLTRLGWAVEKAVMVHAALGHAQVDLKGIPCVLADRTLTDKGRVKDQTLLHSVFVSCLEELSASLPDRARPQLSEDNSDWLTASRSIPTSIMDIIKSTSCRSAIMFNDPLSQEASERLVRRLAECRFPFQCAHGRPSLVPLCEIKRIQQQARDDEDAVSYEEIMQCS